MEGDFFVPRDWNFDKELAVLEFDEFVERYLSDLSLESFSNLFREAVELEEPTYLSGFPSVKTWIGFWEYRSTCDPIKLSNAMMYPEFPPDFPPLDYYTLNKIVFHYLLDVNLMEVAQAFALQTTDDNPDGINCVDYTVFDSVREFIVPFTAYISEYCPISKAGKTFIFPSSKENVDEQTLPELNGQHTEQQPRPPKPPRPKGKPPRPKEKPSLFKGKSPLLSPDLEQLIYSNVMSLLPKVNSILLLIDLLFIITYGFITV